MRAVRLASVIPSRGDSRATGATLGPLTAAVVSVAPASIAEALRLAVDLESVEPFVGGGATLDLWEGLATLAASDVALARAVEPHLDAVTILAQAGVHPDEFGQGATWGVYAAEAPGVRLGAADGGTRGPLLDGVKPWCSLAATVSHALVTAWTSPTERGLFAVGLRQAGVTVDDSAWVARGLPDIPSGRVTFDQVPARSVGEPGWYLSRTGFAWGGMSVAACWFGGAVGVARALLTEARSARDSDPLLLRHLGVVDARLSEARAMLLAAAGVIDAAAGDRGLSGDDASLLAKRVRATVAHTVEIVLTEVGHALGPAPLAHDEAHAKRVADLQLYVAQHHFDRDDASLGRAVRDGAATW